MCGNGKYSAVGAAYCNTAGAGKRITKDNDNLRVGVENCGVNTFSTGANDDCADCEGGHSEAGSSSCVDTPPGHYYDGAHDQPCGAGRFSANGAGCEECGYGKYSAAAAAYCSTAGAGKKITVYNNNLRVRVEDCPKDTASSGATDECSPCTHGHAPVVSASCTKTPVGHYFNEQTSSDLPSPKGTWTEGAANADGCQECEDGFVADKAGSGFSSPCSAGKHVSAARV